MSSGFSNFVSYIWSRAGDTYNYLTDGEVAYGERYTVLRHSRPFVAYQGTKTRVTFTVLGAAPLPADRRVFLQRRGYRTAMLGWTLGAYAGGSMLPGIDVTPVEHTTPAPSAAGVLEADIARLVAPSLAAAQPARQTLHVHVPVSSGDGYFRVRVTTGAGRELATSAAFRVGSVRLGGAQPRGAGPVALAPELLLGTASVALTTAGWAAFYAAFPLLKIGEWTPGPWRAYALRLLYSRAATPEQQARVADGVARGRAGVASAQARVTRVVPFGAVGVRTAADVERDAELGRGGTWYEWPATR